MQTNLLKPLWVALVATQSADQRSQLADVIAPGTHRVSELTVGAFASNRTALNLPGAFGFLQLLAAIERVDGLDMVERVLESEDPLTAYGRLKGLDIFKLPADFTALDIEALLWFRGAPDLINNLKRALWSGSQLEALGVLLDFVQRTPDLFEDQESLAKAESMLKIHGIHPVSFSNLLQTVVQSVVSGDQTAHDESVTLLREAMGTDKADRLVASLTSGLAEDVPIPVPSEDDQPAADGVAAI